jgi:hypothetical protein
MAWQCKLFHYSCVTRLGIRPVFIVHELDRDWHPYYSEIVETGGVVRPAPSFRRTTSGDDYSPRNTAGTLLQAAAIGYGPNDFIVLCDPDMIFLHRPTLPQTLSAERCAHVDYDTEDVRDAARQLGITSDLLNRRKREVECSVPHVIPVADARRIAEAWLEAIDAFRPGNWQTSMYGFGLTLIRLGLKLELTRLVALNDQPANEVGNAGIIHYSYGDDSWNKRHYWYPDKAPNVWKPTVRFPRHTIRGEIISQIEEAAAFYEKRAFNDGG